MADAAREDRHEAATPKRLARAREAGHVALSREVAPAAVLAVSVLMLALLAPMAARVVAERLAGFLTQAHSMGAQAGLHAAVITAMIGAGPFLLAAMAAAVAAVLLQTRFLIHLGAL